MKSKMMMLCLGLISWGVVAQHDNAGTAADKTEGQQTQMMFKDKKVGEAFSHYILLKDALVASKADLAKKASADLAKALSEVEKGEKAGEEANKVAAAGSIAEQRKAFTGLSNEMAALAKTSELAQGSLYLQYCPMANNNSGGSWLAIEKEVMNPYFGDMMLKCGSVKETIQ